MIAALLLCGMAALAPPGDPPPAPGPSASLRFADGAVEVAGLDAGSLDGLRRLDDGRGVGPDVLSVQLATSGPDAPPLPGRNRLVGAVLRFEPKFPIEPGLAHRARFRPSRLPGGRVAPDLTLEFARPRPPREATTSVVGVDPTGAVLPENLLKFYVRFSAPMSRGEVHQRVRLQDSEGKAIDFAFLELGEELWDPSGSRLTLLFDPGRIKRGLRPREEDGPILEAGKSYMLVIDRDWPDGSGNPLREGYRRRFRVGPADRTQPDPGAWTIAAPRASSDAPLVLTFPEPLDRALLDHAIRVFGADGRAIGGTIEIDPGSTSWSYRPDRPWVEGEHRIEVDADLEDLAGNSVGRAFEAEGDSRSGRDRPRTTATRRFRIHP